MYVLPHDLKADKEFFNILKECLEWSDLKWSVHYVLETHYSLILSILK